MRKILFITLVVVAVLAMATAASASVRDGVASLVGDRTGAADDSGGGTYTVTATKTAEEPAASGTGATWALENGDETTGGDDSPYTFRSNTVTEPAESEPDGNADRDADFSGEDVDPEPPVQPDDPVGVKDEEPKAKKGQQEDSTIE